MTDLSAGRRNAPDRLVLVRHGESVGNVADRRAREQGVGKLDLEYRDADTPLSETGERQAEAVGRWVGGLEDGQRPSVALASPYNRAASTAQEALGELDLVDRLVLDERLRERDLGIFDGLTGLGIKEAYPEEAERRSRVGKFYYRPPGGESWCDVIQRVRAVLADIRSEYDGERVWVFSHQAVIMSFRYVLEDLDEETLLGIDTDTPMGNCSVTSYERDADGALTLVEYNDMTAVQAADEPETHEEPTPGSQE
ncbi:histidine phosphatase family protein [Mobilicoccus caccae]|uniref:Phosphoglycerate mutase n=1 Tax=Mobilicoccus caccae TaxID=1859295 RepID=A0ABQ6IYJ6_9MICO|nr:histidine phosphatase family protein [Mobilicoccus caccae]GMA42242.1 phosphoglycerate mutase [Mobilicoccus caccae]